MDDADDQHLVFLNAIEDAVPTVRQAADAVAKFRFDWADQRVSGEQIEGFVKSDEIRVGSIVAKLLEAILSDFHQV